MYKSSCQCILKFSTDPNGTNYDLKGKKPEYSEPMYLDTEGPITFVANGQ